MDEACLPGPGPGALRGKDRAGDAPLARRASHRGARRRAPRQSTSAPDDFTAAPHLAISPWMKVPVWAGAIAIGSAPRSRR